MNRIFGAAHESNRGGYGCRGETGILQRSKIDEEGVPFELCEPAMADSHGNSRFANAARTDHADETAS